MAPVVLTWRDETYVINGLFAILDLDAVFEFVDQQLGYGLVVGLKDNLRQVWLVVQETAEPPKVADVEERRQSRRHAAAAGPGRLRPLPGDDWEVSEERRFFVSNVLWNDLTADQLRKNRPDSESNTTCGTGSPRPSVPRVPDARPGQAGRRPRRSRRRRCTRPAGRGW